MPLSKREQYILLATIIMVMAIVVDRFILTPSLTMWREAKAQRQILAGEVEQAKILFKRKKLMEQKWQEMISGGLSDDISQTESRVLHALRQWSQDCGLMLSSVKPERMSGEDNIREILFFIAGTGSMSAVSRFLWQIEKAALPVRIKDLQLGSRDEQGNDMSLQLRLSAIHLSTKQKEMEVQNE